MFLSFVNIKPSYEAAVYIYIYIYIYNVMLSERAGYVPGLELLVRRPFGGEAPEAFECADYAHMEASGDDLLLFS